MGKTRIHVTPTENGWQSKSEGAQRANAIGPTKADVVQRATEIARNNGNASVIIHKKDGTIQEERTFGKDPFPPRG
jgi:hypothetical protein